MATATHSYSGGRALAVGVCGYGGYAWVCFYVFLRVVVGGALGRGSVVALLVVASAGSCPTCRLSNLSCCTVETAAVHMPFVCVYTWTEGSWWRPASRRIAHAWEWPAMRRHTHGAAGSCVLSSPADEDARVADSAPLSHEGGEGGYHHGCALLGTCSRCPYDALMMMVRIMCGRRGGEEGVGGLRSAGRRAPAALAVSRGG